MINQQKDKIEQEGREKLFSMGFYTSLAATVLAEFGIFVRSPASKLERKLKALEIEHKEIELSQLKKAIIKETTMGSALSMPQHLGFSASLLSSYNDEHAARH